MKKKSKRTFISIYFPDALINDRKKRDFTIAFDKKSLLYEKCKFLSSDEIKKILGTGSYVELVGKAKAEDRSLGNYIKKKLKEKFKINE